MEMIDNGEDNGINKLMNLGMQKHFFDYQGTKEA